MTLHSLGDIHADVDDGAILGARAALCKTISVSTRTPAALPWAGSSAQTMRHPV